MNKKRSPWFLSPDIVFAFVALIIMLVYWYDVFSRSKSYEAVLLTSVMIATFLCVIAMVYSRYREKENSRSTEEKSAETADSAATTMTSAKTFTSLFTRKQLIIIGSLFLYFVGLQIVGFLIVSIAFLFLMQKLLGDHGWKKMLLIAVVIPLIVDYVFGQLFMIHLPTGLLGFGLEVFFQ